MLQQWGSFDSRDSKGGVPEGSLIAGSFVWPSVKVSGSRYLYVDCLKEYVCIGWMLRISVRVRASLDLLEG
jgi:hypothetical protein